MNSKTPVDAEAAHASPIFDLREADEDLWLTLPYVAEDDRAAMKALYSLAVELRRTPAKVSEAPVGEIRLQWWREAIRETAAGKPPVGHPVLGALHAAKALTPAAVAALNASIDARAMFLYPDEIAGPTVLAETIAAAEHWIVPAAIALHRNENVEDALIAGFEALGAAYAVARWGRAALKVESDENGHDERLLALEQFVVERLEDAQKGFAGPADAQSVSRLLFLFLAKGHARRKSGSPWPVLKRLILFRHMLSGQP